ncbi:hypothetical protein EDD11_007467 [Mortierella claussenii]|nr:hypothetical protein EDD11_007467 [Mortierella claussenii]
MFLLMVKFKAANEPRQDALLGATDVIALSLIINYASMTPEPFVNPTGASVSLEAVAIMSQLCILTQMGEVEAIWTAGVVQSASK